MTARTIRRAMLASALALVCAAVADAKPTTISIDGVDHGDGTASYSGKLSAGKACTKGRTVKLVTSAAPGTPPERLGSDKTNKKGKFAFDGKAPDSDLVVINLLLSDKGECPSGTLFHLRYDEVFGA